MLVELGKQCPALERWIVGESCTCEYCEGCLGVFANGVDCGYSKIPTSEPKFKVGDIVYAHPGLQYKIRKVEWDGKFKWVYLFTRERTPHSERNIFATRREYRENEIMRQADKLKKLLDSYRENYGLPAVEKLKKLL